jgi:serpin B
MLFPLATAWAADPATVATNAGGLQIFEAIRAPGNLCISPFSIQSALAMTYAGAAGSTREQMASALGFPDDATGLAKDFQSLNQALEESAKRGGGDTSLNIANRLFGAKGFAFRSAFLDLCSTAFGAPLEPVDFRANPGAAVDRINAWVEKQTQDRIQNLIPANGITRDTTLVLVNALYLKAPWPEEFSKAPDMGFQVAGGQKPAVPAIARTDSFGYKKAGGFTVVGVPFRGGQFQFVLFLPDSPSARLTADLLAECANLPRQSVALTLPKFRLEPPTLPLGETLQGLGMMAAFDIPEKSADFDGIAPRRPDDYLYISNVFHKTFFALDEKGIEAAAATAVVMMRMGSLPAQEDPIEVRADRPFIFSVQHVPTGACLFLGRLSDPR